MKPMPFPLMLPLRCTELHDDDFSALAKNPDNVKYVKLALQVIVAGKNSGTTMGPKIIAMVTVNHGNALPENRKTEEKTSGEL